jgi:hypothetical protein
MNTQLAGLVDEYRRAGQRLERLAEKVPGERWRQRPDPARWSIGECVAHLNLTAEHYVQIVEPALATARQRVQDGSTTESSPRRYRRDLRGWLLWKLNGPPVRLRIRTQAAFVPEGKESPDKLRADFARLQERQIGWVEAADGLPIDQVFVVSPFDARVRYNLFSCLSILPRHEHRHLWQAEQVAKRLR